MRPIDADALERMGYVLTRTYQKDKVTMVYETKKLSDVPSIEQDRKGYWIPDDCDYERRYIYSECKLPFRVETFMMKPAWRFCPNCGCRMEGEGR